jgi:hypothetical protein
MSAEGTIVRYLGTTVVRQDEMSFWLFEAPSTHAVADALERAGITCERIVEAVQLPPRD